MSDRLSMIAVQRILKQRLERRWEEHPPFGLISSAVIVPLIEVNGDVELLYIRRAMGSNDHGGQVSFPGGVREPEDGDLLATANRESVEEVGLEPGAGSWLGALDSVRTLGKYNIQPFVSVWPAEPYRSASPQEVVRVFTVPLDFLMAEGSGVSTEVMVDDRTLTVPAWNFDGEVIWGATRRITLDLVQRLRWGGKPEGL